MAKILKANEFDLDAMKRNRQRKAAKVNLVEGLNQIAPEIGQLRVGQTAMIEGVAPENIRKTVMSITAKLSHLTARGGEWAGRNYDVASDGDAGVVYVQRSKGVDPEEAPIRRTGGGGGRRKKVDTEASGNTESNDESESTVDDGVVITEHA